MCKHPPVKLVKHFVKRQTCDIMCHCVPFKNKLNLLAIDLVVIVMHDDHSSVSVCVVGGAGWCMCLCVCDCEGLMCVCLRVYRCIQVSGLLGNLVRASWPRYRSLSGLRAPLCSISFLGTNGGVSVPQNNCCCGFRVRDTTQPTALHPVWSVLREQRQITGLTLTLEEREAERIQLPRGRSLAPPPGQQGQGRDVHYYPNYYCRMSTSLEYTLIPGEKQ